MQPKNKQFKRLLDSGNLEGVCSTHCAATCPDSGDECLVVECTDNLECIPAVAKDCDDNDACTVDDCDSAIGCTHDTLDCNDADPCTIDTCDSRTGCVNTPKTCNPTGNLCINSVCNPATGVCENSSVVCDDGDRCTDDACDPSTGRCVFSPVQCQGNACESSTCDPITGLCVNQDISSCDDGDSCTADECDGDTGRCVFAASVTCTAPTACVTSTCDPSLGSCVEEDVVCDDNDVCTDDTCNPLTGCVFTAKDCDDGDFCTADSCSSINGCLNVPKICTDDDACTNDSCNPATGDCVFEAISCDDGDACTDDSCNPSSGCVSAAVSGINDGDFCTVDSCDSASGAISNTAIDDCLRGFEESDTVSFGSTVAVSDNNVLVVGSPGSNENAGEVFLYSSDTGAKTATLSGPTGSSFGGSVATCFNGTKVVIGAPITTVGGIAFAGAVHLYNVASGATTVINNPSPVASDFGDQFGSTVAMSTNCAFFVVGAPFRSNARGEVRIYKIDGTPVATVAGANDGDQFGRALAAGTDRFVVGAPGTNENEGKAFEHDFTGTQTSELSTPFGGSKAQFGAAVSIASDDSRTAIGAPAANSNQGSAQVFGTGAGTFTFPVTPETGDSFGSRVAITKDGSLAVSAPGRSGAEGAVAFFPSGGGSAQVFTHPNPLSTDLFGGGLDMGEDGDMIVGVVGDNQGAGSAILFDAF